MRTLVGKVIGFEYERAETSYHFSCLGVEDKVVGETNDGLYIIADPPKVFLRISSEGQIFVMNIYEQVKQDILSMGRVKISEKIAKKIYEEKYKNKVILILVPELGKAEIKILPTY